MIREDRDPAFWLKIASHPSVAPHVYGQRVFDLSAVVSHGSVLPLRTERGGFLFHSLDAFGIVRDLHALFTPDAWGREVHDGLLASLELLFSGACQLVTVQEVEGWWRSRPPRSFGFTKAGDFQPFPRLDLSLRLWTLSKDRWRQSPAYRRKSRCLQPY